MSNYKRIIESFNPYSETNEGYFDKDTREKRREERKERRRERGFNDGGSEEDSLATGKFKISSYVKAVDALKNSIIATLTDVDQHLTNHPNLQNFKDKFKRDLVRAAKVLGEITYLKTKEGNRLENDEDQELIKGYKDIYNSLRNDFEADSEAYKKERDVSIIKALKDLKFAEVGDPLKEANKIFGEARVLLQAFVENLAKGVIGGATVDKDGNPKKEEEKVGAKDGMKIKATIKKGAMKNSEVKAFQQLLIDKFSKDKALTKGATWKAFAKAGGADGNFGDKTGNLVILLKKLYKLEDATSSITQELIDKINGDVVKESLLLSFNSFFNKKNGISEAFSDEDVEAAEASISNAAPIAKKKIVIPTADVKKALIEVKPDVKKVITEVDADYAYKKAKEDFKKEFKLEETVKDLKKIKNVYIVDGFDSSKEYKLDPKNPRKGYFAKCKGLLFFQNNICIRTYDGMVCWYDAETGYFKGKDGWREGISDMIKRGGVPKKMKYFFDLITNALWQTSPEEQEVWDKLLKTDDATIKAILKSFAWMKDEYGDKTDIIAKIISYRKKGKIKTFYDKYKKTIDSLS